MSGPVTVSVITVTFNALEFIAHYLDSVFAITPTGFSLEVLVVDNGSTDGTLALLESEYAGVRLLKNDQNNYARALNLGITAATGDFIVISNNDATVDSGWVQGFLQVIQPDERIGAVQSKILFSESKRINSVGVEEVEHFYYRDIGFEEEDSDRYCKPVERKYVTGGSVMFRRGCLEDVGPWDESFIMFMEDVEYSARCRDNGWKLW
ncbi:MAG: glycosyltransferase family 2 protein, partial [Halioglobus sp.]|nr:glycosyltransferase family 2 protein [Halioglobus sp.]